MPKGLTLYLSFQLMSGSREIIDLNLGPVDRGSRSSSTSSQDKENLSDGEVARGLERLGK